MAFNDLKYQALVGIFDIAGKVIAAQINKPNIEAHEKLTDEYFENLKSFAVQQEKKYERERKQIEYQPEKQEEEQDLVPEKVESGTACLPCSRDHFSTVSGALNEALRFAKKEGVRHPEVMKRTGIALDELNALERLDLHSENLVQLRGKEKKIAEWGLDKSRTLRHKITQIATPEDLENVAAEASQIRTEFMRNLWDVATLDGSVEKLCKGLKEEEKARCISVINKVLEKTPP